MKAYLAHSRSSSRADGLNILSGAKSPCLQATPKLTAIVFSAASSIVIIPVVSRGPRLPKTEKSASTTCVASIMTGGQLSRLHPIARLQRASSAARVSWFIRIILEWCLHLRVLGAEGSCSCPRHRIDTTSCLVHEAFTLHGGATFARWECRSPRKKGSA